MDSEDVSKKCFIDFQLYDFPGQVYKFGNLEIRGSKGLRELSFDLETKPFRNLLIQDVYLRMGETCFK